MNWHLPPPASLLPTVSRCVPVASVMPGYPWPLLPLPTMKVLIVLGVSTLVEVSLLSCLVLSVICIVLANLKICSAIISSSIFLFSFLSPLFLEL